MRRTLASMGLVFCLAASAPAGGAEPAIHDEGFRWEPFAGTTRSASLGQADLANAEEPGLAWDSPTAGAAGIAVAASYQRHEYAQGAMITGAGAAVTARDWRLSLRRIEYTLDGMTFGFPYVPEREGDTFSMTERVDVVGATRLWALEDGARRRQFTFAAGASVRNYTSRIASWDGKGTDFDLAATATHTRLTSHGWLGLRATLMARNLLGRTYTVGGLPAYLPHHAALGLGFAGARTLSERRNDEIGWMFVYAVRRKMRPQYDLKGDAHSFGLEVSYHQALKARVGARTVDMGGGHYDFGFGVDSRGVWDAPLSVTVDYGRMDAGELGGGRDMVSVGVAWAVDRE